jgi:hypothetical protein
MTVGELLARVSSRELAEWQAYLRIEDEERKQAQLGARAKAGLKAGKGDA